MKERIRNIIEQIVPVCCSWIKKGEDGFDRFVDPNDGDEISAHYGATHAAAALILWGRYTQDNLLYQKGISLLDSVLMRWNANVKLQSFHFDFNNFALTLTEPSVDASYSSQIRNVVCRTEDSNHDTVNWLPMRWAVNRKRYAWTGDAKYLDRISVCKKMLAEATNNDGGIEDRIPLGTSFNLQYDLATVAVLQYLRIDGEKIELSHQLGFLLSAVCPDGDINYQGRGTNQVFAWGLWIYLLASSGQTEELRRAVDYMEPFLAPLLKNNNLMLNEWPGKVKYLWWDYHYASVYIAHCLLWTVLAYMHYDKASVSPVISAETDTGLHVHRTEKYFVSWFNGRKEYLSEHGPSIAAIWTRSQGVLCKGVFAPWQGPFGNKYTYEDIALKNYCGLLKIKRNIDFTKNRVLHKLFKNINAKEHYTIMPVFEKISLVETSDYMEIEWGCPEGEFIFNFPSFKQSCDLRLYVDGEEKALFCDSAIKNQYSWVYLYQSRCFSGRYVKLLIK